MARTRKPAPEQWPAGFTEADRAMFDRIRVSAALVVAAGIRRVTSMEARNAGRLEGKGDMSGVLYPYVDWPRSGDLVTCRVRLDKPTKDMKYIAPPAEKARRILYYPPDARAKLEGRRDIYFVLVEAEKSALALTAWAERIG